MAPSTLYRFFTIPVDSMAILTDVDSSRQESTRIDNIDRNRQYRQESI
ncbi:MAG: hypothetical protein LUD17_03425 [Bacteroidales bacterium]|nr:hypothetical protein [Bacteroidales bacterium]